MEPKLLLTHLQGQMPVSEQHGESAASSALPQQQLLDIVNDASVGWTEALWKYLL